MAARTACACHLVCIYSGPDRGLKQLEREQVVILLAVSIVSSSEALIKSGIEFSLKSECLKL